MNVKTAIQDFICRYPKKNILVALSGGKDSIALAYSLKEIGAYVTACHINHNLRGSDSLNDENFVKEFCSKNFISLTVKSVTVTPTKHQSLEAAARNIRYSILNEVCPKDTLIATAHNSSDNAETVILNMLRGTGLKGLCGIPPERENIVRPLIKCSSAEILSYLKENNLSFVFDKSNNDSKFTRNKIRNEIFPKLLEINPSLYETLSRESEILRLENSFLEKQAFLFYKKAYLTNTLFSIPKLLNAPFELLPRIITMILTNNNISPSFLIVKEALDLIILGEGKVNIKKNTYISAKKNFFSISY